MAEPSFKLSLKLVIDKKANIVLFAEAGKEAVDFICSFLTLPVGTVTRLLSEQGMVGCLSDLYRSIEKLNDICLQPNEHKDIILKPNVCNATEENSLFKLTNLPDKNPETPMLYTCYNYCPNVTRLMGIKCPVCNKSMESKVRFQEVNTVSQIEIPVVSKAGFVNGAVNFIVMDDLAVSPTSAAGVFSYLKKLNLDMKLVEEKVIDLDMDKGLKMLKKSLQSKKVLTEVFLQGQRNADVNMKRLNPLRP